jgi:hypothetical protein
MMAATGGAGTHSCAAESGTKALSADDGRTCLRYPRGYVLGESVQIKGGAWI